MTALEQKPLMTHQLESGVFKMEDNKVKYVVLDLEFLGHDYNSVVTAIGVATVTLTKQGGRVSNAKEDVFGGRIAELGLEFQREHGGTVDESTVKWAQDNDMDTILSELDEVYLPELVQQVATIINEADYVMERSVGADVPKFLHLCKLLNIEVDIPYWKIMEVRSFLAGAGASFLNSVWNPGLTKHNPICDALMDVIRIEYASDIRNMSVAGRNMAQFVLAGGGTTAKVDEVLKVYHEEELKRVEAEDAKE